MNVLDKNIPIYTVPPSPSQVENVITPFRLYLNTSYFEAESHQSFSEFLTGDSVAGLMQLEIDIPKNGGSMDFVFPERFPILPALQKFLVRFCEEEEKDNNENFPAHGSNSYFLPFIQSILNGATELKEFHLPFITDRHFPPVGVGFLTLPRTLTKLTLDCVLTSSQLEGLALNPLPSLLDLLLTIPTAPFANGLVFCILDKCKSTLRKLKLKGICYEEQEDIPKRATTFAFPVMQHLDSFVCNSVQAELEAGLCCLQKFLPNLTALYLTNQTVHRYRKWTGNSRFPNVTRLTVCMIDDGANYQVTFRLEEMRALHMAFPNVSILKIKLAGKETRGLKYLFGEMQQITKLTIVFENTAGEISDSIHWDALLTGLPLKLVGVLATIPQFWEHVEKINLKQSKFSLRNLKALQTLKLISRDTMEGYGDVARKNSLISDAVFYLAFLNMPTLQNLRLKGRFMASPNAIQAWRAAGGRSISYSYRSFPKIDQTISPSYKEAEAHGPEF